MNRVEKHIVGIAARFNFGADRALWVSSSINRGGLRNTTAIEFLLGKIEDAPGGRDQQEAADDEGKA